METGKKNPIAETEILAIVESLPSPVRNRVRLVVVGKPCESA
jgi:hypothetical protein